MRIGNGLFAVLFALAVAVQYNDPDPIQWSLMYGAAVACCLAWEVRRTHRAAPIAVGAIALVWGLVIAMGIRLTTPVGEALVDWNMHAGGSEELRESIGLFLVAAWMAFLAWRPRRR